VAQNEELVRSNRELEQFASVVSHDLQQPLQSILGYTKLIGLTCPAVQQSPAQPYLESILNASNRMQQMIQDWLAYAQAGQAQPTCTPVDGNALLDQVMLNLKVALTETRAELHYGDLPTVLGSEVQLMQLFQNLLSNALKFARPDAVPQITLSVKPLPQAWRFGIHDNGIGIEAAHLGQIFEAFHRLHDAQSYPGSGIGLATCQKIVEHHGGPDLGRVAAWARQHLLLHPAGCPRRRRLALSSFYLAFGTPMSSLTLFCCADAPAPVPALLAAEFPDCRVVLAPTRPAVADCLEQLSTAEVAVAIAPSSWLDTGELRSFYDRFPQALMVVLDPAVPQSDLTGAPLPTSQPGSIYRRLPYPGADAELVFTVAAALGQYRQGQQLNLSRVALAAAHRQLDGVQRRMSALMVQLDWGVASVSDRAHTEQALRRSQSSLAEAQRIAQLGSWEFDLASQTISWSAELFRHLRARPGPERAQLRAVAADHSPGGLASPASGH
jgi:hypothetical protein